MSTVTSLKWYFRIYEFVARERLKRNDTDQREIHTVLVVVLSTGILMWAYALLACLTIASPIPGAIGLIASTVHLFSPVLFRFTHKSSIPTNVLLTAGIVHQGTFAFFTGGFQSNILIWFGILPMIGGMICRRKGAITWFYWCFLVSFVFFVLHLNGHVFPNLISETGKLWSQALLVFGWIFLSSTIVIVYAGLGEHAEILLKDQGQKIDDLFRVLFHDLANPLGRVAIGVSIAKKQLPNGENNRGLEIAETAADTMLEITQNVRRMYAVRKGKANVDLTLTSLNSSVEYILKLYGNDLEKKQITLSYNFDRNSGLQLLVEPVSFCNQVLGNVISNAIKFSPIGSDISLTAYPVSQDVFAIEVKDNGIGIPASLMTQLFDINKKTTRSGTNGETGTGFGMHIIKSFVEMYGGQLQIESKEGQGGEPSGSTVKLFLRGEWG